MKATLTHYRQPPRKVRLVARQIHGLSVPKALALLRVLDKKVAGPLQKLISSAVANAGKVADTLAIDSVTVNQGMVLKRYRPRAFGRATPNVRRTSTIQVLLAETKVAGKAVKKDV